MARLLLVIMLVVGMVGLSVRTTTPAHACSIAAFELEPGAEQAGVVVLGRLVAAGELTATFEVEYAFGGDPLPADLDFDNRVAGLAADCSLIYEDEPRYLAGTYLAFLDELDDGLYAPSWFGYAMVMVDGDTLIAWTPELGSDDAPPPRELERSLDDAVAWLAANVGEPVKPRTPRDAADDERSSWWLVAPIIFGVGAISAGLAAWRLSRYGGR